MSELVNEHKRTYDDDTMRNLTDVYLKQIKESNDPNFNGKYNVTQSIVFWWTNETIHIITAYNSIRFDSI